MNGTNVAKFTHFRRSTYADRLDNADAVYVILSSLVSNGVAMFVL